MNALSKIQMFRMLPVNSTARNVANFAKGKAKKKKSKNSVDLAICPHCKCRLHRKRLTRHLEKVHGRPVKPLFNGFDVAKVVIKSSIKQTSTSVPSRELHSLDSSKTSALIPRKASFFYAAFESRSAGQIRIDTRVYFKGGVKTREHGVCRGSIVMCNPGGARPMGENSWGPIIGDQTLWSVLGIMAKAINDRENQVSEEDYLEVLNCCYLVNTDAPSACKCGYFQKVHPTSRFVWLAWGQEKDRPTQNALKILATLGRGLPCFWYDKNPSSLGVFPPVEPVHPLPTAWRSRWPDYQEKIAAEMARHL